MALPEGKYGWYLEGRPRVPRWHQFYLDAFWELLTDVRFEGGSIPWSSIVDYGQRSGVAACMMDHFTYVVRSLERAHLEDQKEVRRKNKKGKKVPGGGGEE